MKTVLTQAKSEELSRQYVEKRGVRCPYCDSEHIAGDFVSTDASEARQTVDCADCGGSWVDVYELRGIVFHELPKEGWEWGDDIEESYISGD